MNLTALTSYDTHPSVLSTGWLAFKATYTFSYVSADSPTFVISGNANLTTLLSVGMRFQCVNAATTINCIITAIGSYTGGATQITLLVESGKSIANSAITSPYFSMQKAPFGFPMDEATWSVELNITDNTQQLTPANGTWYNIGTKSLTIPIGKWRVYYFVCVYLSDAASRNYRSTLSIANNSESDTEMTSAFYTAGAGDCAAFMTKEKLLTLIAKTIYYLNTKTMSATTAVMSFLSTTQGNGKIKAISTYL